jgi:acyl-CoA synthetase (AMP-forming)/AMP-acid ligase II
VIPLLLGRMQAFGDAPAIAADTQVHTYSDLLQRANLWENRLSGGGVSAGSVVALEVGHLADAAAALLALAGRGAIVVPLTGLPPARQAELHETAQVEFVVTPDGREPVSRTGRSADHELYASLRRPGSPGLVLFSSGTSGRSKAAVLDFSKVLGRYRSPARPSRTLCFMNIDHIGGVNTLLHTLSHGGMLVTVAERSPDSVLGAVAQHRVEVLPTTPTFLNMLLISGAAERHDISSLQLITYGTEVMPLGTLQAMRRILPQVRFKQTYGLSELGILPTKSKSDDTLWLKLGGSGFDYKIVDGVLWVRSEMAMTGYLNAPAPFDADGYFNTQDVVEVDGEYLRILGRKSEIINVGGEKVFPAEVENVIQEAGNIADVTVSGRPSHVVGMVVKATVRLVTAEEERSAARRIRQHCEQRLEGYKVPAVIEISDAAHHSERFKKTRNLV